MGKARLLNLALKESAKGSVTDWSLGAIIVSSNGKIIGKGHNRYSAYIIHSNGLKDRRYLRENQFDMWDMYSYNSDVFIKPEIIIKNIKGFSF